MYNHVDCEHIFNDNAAFFDSDGGFCVKCGKHHDRPRTQPDISSGGYPCQSFSLQRDQSALPVHLHPAYNTVTQEFEKYLDSRDPGSFWMEEVTGFLRRLAVLGNKSACELVKKQCERRRYSVRVLIIDHGTFVNIRRERVFLIGVHEREGGMKAVIWVVKQISAALDFRARTPPSRWLEVVNLYDDEQQERLRCSEAIRCLIAQLPDCLIAQLPDCLIA